MHNCYMFFNNNDFIDEIFDEIFKGHNVAIATDCLKNSIEYVIILKNKLNDLNIRYEESYKNITIKDYGNIYIITHPNMLKGRSISKLFIDESISYSKKLLEDMLPVVLATRNNRVN